MTGEHSGNKLVEQVGLIVNDVDLGVVPISQEDPLYFQYYKMGMVETDVAQVYLADADGKELVRADVPISLPAQDLVLMIDGKEQTTTYTPYEVQEITQPEYLALAEKDPAVVYAVQPDDEGSARVYFLGDAIIDRVRNADGLVYTRNLIPNTTSEWQEFTISDWTSNQYKIEIDNIPIKGMTSIAQSFELDNTTSGNTGGVRSFIAQYDATGTQLSTKSGTTIAVGHTGESRTFTSIDSNAAELILSIGHSINTATDVGKYRCRKAISGSEYQIAPYTVAPEDILGTPLEGIVFLD